MKGFERYDDERAAFRRGPLYPVKYKAVVRFLARMQKTGRVFNRTHFAGAEFRLDAAGVQLREIVREARRAGHKIASRGNGYYWEPDYEAYVDSLAHLHERAMSQLYTIQCAKRRARKNVELRLRLRTAA